MFRILSVFFLLLILPTLSVAQEAGQAKFTPDIFFGGVSVRLDELQQNERYQRLPIDQLVSADISLGNLDSQLVSEFSIFVKNPDGLNLSAHSKDLFEIAAVINLKEALSKKLDEKRLAIELAKWKNRTSPWLEPNAVKMSPIEVASKRCFEVPAGTLLNSRHRFASAPTFYGRKGDKLETGINAGKLTKRRFISGDDKSRAVIEIQSLSSSELIDNSLSLSLELDVVATATRIDREYCLAEIYLQQPGGKLRTKSIQFDANSNHAHLFKFPKRLTVVDVEGMEQVVDLIDDFAGKDGIQLVLKCLEPTSYIGVKRSDVKVRFPASEYVCLTDGCLVVAQSKTTLEAMLTAKPGKLAQRLKFKEGQQVVGHLQCESESNRASAERLLEFFGLEEVVALWSKTIRSASFGFAWDQEQVFQAALEFDNGDPAIVQERIRNAATNIKPIVKETLNEYVLRQDTMSNLAAMWARLPSPGFPDKSVDRKRLFAQQHYLADCIFEALETSIEGENLIVTWDWPLRENVAKYEVALATLLHVRSMERFQQEDFFRYEQIERLIFRAFPRHTGLAFRFGHHLAFNTSAHFDGLEAKYYWVRRGINVLLDAAEEDPDSIDCLWYATGFIGSKIGRSDERFGFQELFSQDKALHERLKKYISVEEMKDQNQNVNCFLTAMALSEHCKRQVIENAKSSPVSTTRIAMDSALFSIAYAHSLDEKEAPVAAEAQWRIALEALKTVGDVTVKSESGEPVIYNRLVDHLYPDGKFDLDEIMTKFRINMKQEGIFWHPAVVKPNDERQFLSRDEVKGIAYQVKLYQVELELDPIVRKIRAHQARAGALSRKSQFSDAGDEYLKGIKLLTQFLDSRSSRKKETLFAFEGFINAYSRILRRAKKETPAEQESLVEKLKSTAEIKVLNQQFLE